MVSSDKSAVHNVSSDKLHQRLSSHSDITVSQEIHDNKICSSKPEVARSIPLVAADKEVQDSDATAYALQSDQEGSTCSLPLEKTLQSPNTFPCRLQSGRDSPPLKYEKVSKDIVAEKEVLDSDATVCALQSDQERSTSSLPLEKPLQNPNTVPKLQYCQDSPSIIREKVSKDGYNWRKYGQKHVRGNEFIRNYYKCTHPNCHAKKQLEQSNSGQITDTICIGQHNHPQVNTPLPVDCVVTAVKERPDKPSSANLEDQASIEHGCVPQQTKPLDALPISTVSASHEVKAAYLQSTIIRDEVLTNESPDSKRLKKDNSNADVTGVEKLTSESRVVVQTSSEVDFVNDGYRWRKYGQKLVKGNPNPRSYYRCSNLGCPVKKHVERASHDQKIVITTYEGHHDHESPSGRTVTHNGAANTPTTNINGKSGTKSRVNMVCAHTGENTCMDSKDRLNGEKTGESKSGDRVEVKTGESRSGDRVEVNVITPSSGIPESTSSEQEQNSNPGTKKDSVSLEIICHSDSTLPCILNEQLKDEVRTTSEESKDECLNVATVHDTRHPENK